MQNRCVNMIAHLFHAPVGDDETAIGVGTVGSSEAIMLAGLAFKRKWQARRREQGKPCDNPNIVTGANVQVCWEKFARYFEVELKEVKLQEGCYVMDPCKAVDMVDENTICVAAILGSTLTGEFEDVKLLNELLTKKNEETGWDVPIHVDAASGGFIAPFIYPDLEWDFRLPLLSLMFNLNYQTLHTSKGSSQIIAQYYQFIRLGFEGYKSIMENCQDNARMLREGIADTGHFEIVSKEVGVPLVAFSLKDTTRYSVFDISESLRRFGWIVPAYTMPPDAEHVAVLRVVIREEFSHSLADRLITDMKKVLEELDQLPPRETTKVTRVNAVVDETQSGRRGSVHPVKKSVSQAQREVVSYWRRISDKKTSGVC
ncbi:hypothetical protein Leryth_027476 [Lithospermum erythrorhizon]|nr:hypothetical protein Leryth_027476 [Lithospermum erythrorhizon]